MPPAKTVHLDTHAAATLRYIRASMDAARSVAVPGSAGIAMGVVGCTAALVSLTPDLRAHWFLIWLAAAPIAAGLGAVLLMRPSSLASFAELTEPGRKLALCLLPCVFAGAVITAVLWSGDRLSAAPGTWLLLYGCALMSASVLTTGLIAWLGACFVALGVAAFFAPLDLQLVLLGVGFGGLHMLFGVLLSRGANVR